MDLNLLGDMDVEELTGDHYLLAPGLDPLLNGDETMSQMILNSGASFGLDLVDVNKGAGIGLGLMGAGEGTTGMEGVGTGAGEEAGSLIQLLTDSVGSVQAGALGTTAVGEGGGLRVKAESELVATAGRAEAEGIEGAGTTETTAVTVQTGRTGGTGALLPAGETPRIDEARDMRRAEGRAVENPLRRGVNKRGRLHGPGDVKRELVELERLLGLTEETKLQQEMEERAKMRLALRKQRNKESARRYREKQLAKKKELEERTRALSMQNKELEAMYEKIMRTEQKLRGMKAVEVEDTTFNPAIGPIPPRPTSFAA